ncbi:DUF3632 domain-containing protein [Aspergillus thermomutatus]|uniref:Uncharacterized protein n=1 Tax=Aspergillus thermomutatus TaxID=41047 RepID=A0A397GTJ4_ASPTH|nr:uncharacterized protein CDV56_103418 [Aspergillus thermomutatus]RHZ52988.1 hypothetical protein CDV56_103418 [Aspergillus thermomutatus]
MSPMKALSKIAPSGCGIDIARTPDGAVWNDLPFLDTDMTDFWVNDCVAMGAKQRLNAASFLAKLASTRVAKDRLCQIALLLFRDTFEAVRPLGSSNEPDDEDPRRTMHVLTIAALLPSACAWIREAGHNIILLSDVSWNDCSSSTIGKGGFTFVKSELGQRVPGGFTKADEMGLAEHAAKAIDIMLGNVKERNSQILRVFESAGDAVHQDKDLLGPKKKW